jgi:hypothetical protein
VKIFNRSKKDLPMSAATPPTGEMVTAQTDGAANKSQRFAQLSHTDADGNADGYALAVAGTESYTYPFLNGSTMTTAVPAIIAEDKSGSAASGFNCTSGEFHSTDTQVLLLDDVINTFTYHVYTNGTSGASVYDGIEAISVDQSEEEARDGYDYVPTLPNEARSPLLTLDQYTYYEAKDDMGNSSKELKNLYGLYEGDVYVRYSYDPDKSEYLVPNQRNDLPTTDGKVDKGSTSNDSPLRFGDKLLYNIIWYNDEIMKSKDDGTGVESESNQPLKYAAEENKYQWNLLGDDPYAIKIWNVGAEKYISSVCTTCNGTGKVGSPEYDCETCSGSGIIATCSLSENHVASFMLLNRDDGFRYGMLARTGDKTAMLSLDGGALFHRTMAMTSCSASMRTNGTLWRPRAATVNRCWRNTPTPGASR